MSFRISLFLEQLSEPTFQTIAWLSGIPEHVTSQNEIRQKLDLTVYSTSLLIS